MTDLAASAASLSRVTPLLPGTSIFMESDLSKTRTMSFGMGADVSTNHGLVAYRQRYEKHCVQP